MGLFGRLLGRRRPDWAEAWQTYPGTVADAPAVWAVDLGALALAPVAALPVRMDVMRRRHRRRRRTADRRRAGGRARGRGAGRRGRGSAASTSAGWPAPASCRFTAHLPGRADHRRSRCRTSPTAPGRDRVRPALGLRPGRRSPRTSASTGCSPTSPWSSVAAGQGDPLGDPARGRPRRLLPGPGGRRGGRRRSAGRRLRGGGGARRRGRVRADRAAQRPGRATGGARPDLGRARRPSSATAAPTTAGTAPSPPESRGSSTRHIRTGTRSDRKAYADLGRWSPMRSQPRQSSTSHPTSSGRSTSVAFDRDEWELHRHAAPPGPARRRRRRPRGRPGRGRGHRRHRGDRVRSGLAEPAGAGGGGAPSTPSRTRTPRTTRSARATAPWCRPWPPAGTPPRCSASARRSTTPRRTATWIHHIAAVVTGVAQGAAGDGDRARPGRPGREPLPVRTGRRAAPDRLSCPPWRMTSDPVSDVGVGPWVGPWPADDRYDPRAARRRRPAQRGRPVPVLAARGVVADLDARRHDFHVAIENWQHDLNIGTVVRTANAFLAARGAHRRAPAVEPARRDGDRPVPARALPRRRRPTWSTWAAGDGLVVVGVDNLPGSVPIETVHLPRRCVLLFGQEGPGLSDGRPGGGARWSARSPSTARPGRSTPGWPAASPCTPGSASTPRPRRDAWTVAWILICRPRPGRAEHTGRVSPSCPRCGGEVRPPDLMQSPTGVANGCGQVRRCTVRPTSRPRSWSLCVTGYG